MDTIEKFKEKLGTCKTKEEEIELIEIIYERLQQGKTDFLDIFLQKYAKINSNLSYFYTPFFLAYHDARWRKANKPLTIITNNMWKYYNKIKQEEKTSNIAYEDLQEESIIIDEEERIIDKIYYSKLLENLDEEERKLWEDYLYGYISLDDIKSSPLFKKSSAKLKKLLKNKSQL